MSNIIEQLLEEKSRGTESEVFFTQWLLARDYVPKVQSVIIRTFPHFSQHDASHSEAILNAVVRVLGKEAISTLGSVDLWLLLSAAYYHDIGMAVFANDIESAFNDREYFQFVLDCQKDVSHPLNRYASIYDVKEDGIYYKPALFDGKTYDSATFLLAEFIRKQHARRSKESISLDQSIHLAGEPIPNRIIRLLGRICEMHAKTFDQVMSLPVCEAGLGMDDCHPRFIACMLRIGDLLDLDNNRFSTTFLKTLTSIPSDSLLHKEKHFAIEHLRIDKSRVEVTARCDNYDVADISNRWFEMISDEFRQQREIWGEIVPKEFSGHLPSIGEMKVELIGYDTIDGKKRPSFEIDTSKAIEMLQGAGLYTRPSQCIRELLQNAVDATYIHIFLESGSISLEEFLDRCSKKDIRVSIDKGGIDGDSIIWKVEIEDFGTGMSKEDLLFLTKTGSKSPEKTRIIASMPEHMRPSGTFGIGFQSVFLMTDKVELTTRKIDSSQEITAELFNPSGPRHGAVLLKSKTAQMHPGTKLHFEFKSDKNLNHWSFSSGEVFSSHAVYSYDFVADKTLDLDTAKILDEIRLFTYACPVNLVITLNGEKIEMPRFHADSFDYYSKRHGIQVCINRDGATDLFFRNQPIQKHGIIIPYVDVKANILGGNAKDLLTLNRDEVRYQARTTVKESVIQTLVEAILNKPDLVPDSVLAKASMFMLEKCPKDRQCPARMEESWKDYAYRYIKGSKWETLDHSFGKIVSMAENKKVVWIKGKGPSCSVKEKDDAVLITLTADSDDTLRFLLKRLFQTHPYPNNDISAYTTDSGFSLSKEPVEPIGDYRTWAQKYLSNSFYARSLMPCNSPFKALQIKPSANFNFSQDETFPVRKYPKMICPYIRIFHHDKWDPSSDKLEWNDADGELYHLTYTYRADESVTLDQIKEVYAEFRKMMDPIIHAAIRR